ncbi:MAG: hypothetical protein V4612_02735 [Pseudomonadota bacterium]
MPFIDKASAKHHLDNIIKALDCLKEADCDVMMIDFLLNRANPSYPLLYGFQKRNNSDLNLIFISEEKLLLIIIELSEKLAAGHKLRFQCLVRDGHTSALDVEIVKQINGEISGSLVILDSSIYRVLSEKTTKQLSEKNFVFYRPSSELGNRSVKFHIVVRVQSNKANKQKMGSTIYFDKKDEHWFWYNSDKAPGPLGMNSYAQDGERKSISDLQLISILEGVAQEIPSDKERVLLMQKMDELYLQDLYDPLPMQKDRTSCAKISLDLAKQASKIEDLHHLAFLAAQNEDLQSPMLRKMQKHLDKAQLEDLKVISWQDLPKEILKNSQSRTFFDYHTQSAEFGLKYSDVRHIKRFANQFQWFVKDNISEDELLALAHTNPFGFVITNDNNIRIIIDGVLLTDVVFMEDRSELLPLAQSALQMVANNRELKAISGQLINFLSDHNKIKLPDLIQADVTTNRHQKLLRQAASQRAMNEEGYDRALEVYLTELTSPVDKIIAKAVPINHSPRSSTEAKEFSPVNQSAQANFKLLSA